MRWKSSYETKMLPQKVEMINTDLHISLNFVTFAPVFEI